MIKSITSASGFRISFINWWILCIVAQFGLLSRYRFSVRESLADSLISNCFLAAACLLITLNLKYYLPRKERYWYVLIISGAVSGFWLLITKTCLRIVLRDHRHYLDLLDQSIYLRYVIGFLMIGCMAVLCLLWYTLQEQQEAHLRREQAEQLSKDAELLKLRQQLQPHFLFNSLNSISALAGSQPERARSMIHQLSEFLRGTLRKEEKQMINLAEELHHLSLYLEIEKVRFGQRLQTSIETNEASDKAMIPSLLLQPVVENAIKFGLYDTTGPVIIHINTSMAGGYLTIEVTNPFDPDTAVSGRGTGFGLASIRRRLYLLYARQDLLETRTEEQIFITQIRIPQQAI
jgi:TRAP-type C4-dicarboxylate transport system permease small subunit